MIKKLPKPDSAKPVETDRAFKTAWFAKEARKAKIADKELCHAIRQVMQRQAYLYAKKTAKTLHRMNWLHSKSLRKITVARVMP